MSRQNKNVAAKQKSHDKIKKPRENKKVTAKQKCCSKTKKAVAK